MEFSYKKRIERTRFSQFLPDSIKIYSIKIKKCCMEKCCKSVAKCCKILTFIKI